MFAEIILPAGTKHVAVAEIPPMIAEALNPEPTDTRRTVSRFIKLARPGATGELAKWNGWPLEDADRNELERAWSHLPPLPEPTTEDLLTPYLEAANASDAQIGWELGVIWNNPALSTAMARIETERRHQKALVTAIRKGAIRVISPMTRLPTDEYDANAVMAVNEFANYVAQFDISILNPAPNDEEIMVEVAEKTRVSLSGLGRKEILSVDWPLINGFNEASFSRALSDVPKWLKPARIAKGAPGKGSALWNPAIVAACLLEKNYARQVALANLMRKSFPEWLEQWSRQQGE